MNELITFVIAIVSFMTLFGGLYGIALLFDRLGIITIVEDEQ